MNPISSWLYQKSIETKIISTTKENQGITSEDLIIRSQIKKDDFNKIASKLEKNYVLVNLDGKYFTAKHIINYFYEIRSKLLININSEVVNELTKKFSISKKTLKDIMYSHADREEMTLFSLDN